MSASIIALGARAHLHIEGECITLMLIMLYKNKIAAIFRIFHQIEYIIIQS